MSKTQFQLLLTLLWLLWLCIRRKSNHYLLPSAICFVIKSTVAYYWPKQTKWNLQELSWELEWRWKHWIRRVFGPSCSRPGLHDMNLIVCVHYSKIQFNMKKICNNNFCWILWPMELILAFEKGCFALLTNICTTTNRIVYSILYLYTQISI